MILVCELPSVILVYAGFGTECPPGGCIYIVLHEHECTQSAIPHDSTVIAMMKKISVHRTCLRQPQRRAIGWMSQPRRKMETIKMEVYTAGLQSILASKVANDQNMP